MPGTDQFLTSIGYQVLLQFYRNHIPGTWYTGAWYLWYCCRKKTHKYEGW